jgi:hypothetical protein
MTQQNGDDKMSVEQLSEVARQITLPIEEVARLEHLRISKSLGVPVEQLEKDGYFGQF